MDSAIRIQDAPETYNATGSRVMKHSNENAARNIKILFDRPGSTFGN